MQVCFPMLFSHHLKQLMKKFLRLFCPLLSLTVIL